LSNDRHVVLPRGIPAPPQIRFAEARLRVRESWGIDSATILVLYAGRIVRGKGVFDLMDAVRMAALQHPQLRCALVGSVPGFDDTFSVQQKLLQDSFLNQHVQIFPSCDPDRVWDLLCAADIFALPSFGEGMPNALLEAMSMGVASVAYAIPPLVELEKASGGLMLVPTGDKQKLAEAILYLCSRPQERLRLGQEAKETIGEQFMVKKNTLEALRRMENLVRKSSDRNMGDKRLAASVNC
jgi:glycosyltransferase involved in cell wall biosynthesis